MRRYPVQPLLDLSGWPYSRLVGQVNSEAWNSMKTRGLTPYMADKLAVKIGFHPSEVWPSWFADEEAEMARRCAECDTPFIPGRSDQRFCTRLCGQRKYQRTYLARKRLDPEFRAAEAARVAAWRAECPGYVALDNKRRRQAAPSQRNSEAKRRGNRAYYQRHRDKILAQKRAKAAEARAMREQRDEEAA